MQCANHGAVKFQQQFARGSPTILKTIIKGGTVITAADTFAADLLLEGGCITQMGANLPAAGARVVDAGGMLLLPFALQHGLQFAYPANGWLLLLYIGLVPTVGGYGLYLWGLQTTPAPVAAIIALIEPLLGAGLALSLLGETLAPAAGAGGALLLASICALLLLHARESTRAALP